MATMHVTDVGSFGPQQIENAAAALSSSAQLRSVFEYIYTGKRQPKTADEIHLKTGISKSHVLDHIRRLDTLKLIDRQRVKQQTVCYKIGLITLKKSSILKMAQNKKKLQKFKAANRGLDSLAEKIVIKIPKGTKPRAIRVTIDDIESFAKVKSIGFDASSRMAPISERKFNNGVRRILGGPWEQKDWGGEDDDLTITTLKYRGRRLSSAFAFKGPATRPPLTVNKMGSSGNQILRLFKNDMELYIVQFQGEVSPDIAQELAHHARSHSVYSGAPVYYMVIDGQDSERLIKAYPAAFKN